MQIAIDSAIFPKGTNGAQLDVLARKNLWQDGLNYNVSRLSMHAFFLILAHDVIGSTIAWDGPWHWVVPQRTRRFTRVLKQCPTNSWPRSHERARLLSVRTHLFLSLIR